MNSRNTIPSLALALLLVALCGCSKIGGEAMVDGGADDAGLAILDGALVAADAAEDGGHEYDAANADLDADAALDAEILLDAAAEIDARVVQPDAGPPPDCTSDRECDDGLFCTGVEHCVAGHCEASAVEGGNDGIGCTSDVCDEATDSFRHVADDASCAGFTTGNMCDGSRRVRFIGYCDVTTGCAVREDALENCQDAVPNNQCIRGRFSSYGATCDDGSGCGYTTTETACPDQAATCTGGGRMPLVLTTYSPSCADSTSCGSPAARTTTCTTSPSCVGRVYTQWAPTCDATAETCGQAVSATQDCASLDACTIYNFGSGCGVAWSQGTCDATTGCAAGVAQMAFCAPGHCACGSTPGCT